MNVILITESTCDYMSCYAVALLRWALAM